MIATKTITSPVSFSMRFTASAMALLVLIVLGFGFLQGKTPVVLLQQAAVQSLQKTSQAPAWVEALTAQPVLKQGLQPVFQSNLGQFDESVRYVATGNGYQAYLTDDQLGIVRSVNGQAYAVTMDFLNANQSVQTSATEQGSEIHHYYTRSRTVENVPTYGRVQYRSLYNGIDAVFYSRQGRMEYDFNVQAGADPVQIGLLFRGITHVELAANGDLLLASQGGVLRQKAPVSYQQIDGQRVSVESRYRTTNTAEGLLVNFELGAYRQDHALVIDPILDYGTYLGGTGNDTANAVETYEDTVSIPNRTVVYITGETASNNFPYNPTATTVGVDAYVAAIDTKAVTGSQVLFVTHVGGNGNDIAHALAVDSNGNAFIAGETSSNNLPAVNTFQTVNNSINTGTLDAFVAKINKNGLLTYLTYFGGDDDEVAFGIDVDSNGNVYIAGRTQTDNANIGVNLQPFPIPATTLNFTRHQQSGQTSNPYNGSVYQGGCSQGFVAKLDAAAGTLVYASYIGGEGAGNLSPSGNCSGAQEFDDAVFDVAVDVNGRAFLTGTTVSPLQFPVTSGAFDVLCGSDSSSLQSPANSTCSFAGGTVFSDAFLSVISADGLSMEYSTYLGGNKDDVGYALDVKDDGSMVFITGSTRSFDEPASQTNEAFPTSTAPRLAAQPRLNGINGNTSNTPLADAFLTVLRPNGSGDVDRFYSSYFGAGGDVVDIGRDVIYDRGTATGAEQVYIVGETSGVINLGAPVNHKGSTEAALPTNNNSIDGFIAQFSINSNATVPFKALIGGEDSNPVQNPNPAIINTAAVDRAEGIAIDANGGIYIVGSTQSEVVLNTNVSPNVFNGFPVTVGAAQTECGDPAINPTRLDDCNANANSPTDAFLIKLTQEADLALSLVTPVLNDQVNATAPFDYVFQVANNGPELARNVQLTASITGTSNNPASPFSYTFLDNNSNTQQGVATVCTQPTGGGGDIVCTVANIPNGGSQQISFKGVINDTGTVTVDATVTTSSTDPDLTNNTKLQGNSIVTGQLFDVEIAMVPSKTVGVIGGEQVSYTVTVTNNGPNSSGALKVNFPLTSQLEFISLVPSNALAGTCVEADKGVGQDCLLAASIQNVAGLKMGEQAQWTLVLRPLPPGGTPSFTMGGATVIETAQGPGKDSDSLNNNANPPIEVLPGADLGLTVSTTNLGGGGFRYDLTMRNFGPSLAEAIKLRTDLPAALKNPSSVQGVAGDCLVANHGSVTANATNNGIGFVECTFENTGSGPTMAIDGIFDWSIKVDGSSGASGLVPLTFSFTSATGDPDLTNNTVTKSVNLGGGSGGNGGGGGGALSVWFLLGLMLFCWMFLGQRGKTVLPLCIR